MTFLQVLLLVACGGNGGQECVKITASEPTLGSEYGTAISVEGDDALVGAPGAGVAGTGLAYVLSRDVGGKESWGETQTLIGSDSAPGDWFGFSVALNGDTAVVGAPLDGDRGRDSGSVYVFVRGPKGEWGQVKKLTGNSAVPFDTFGWSVSVSGDVVLVGAPEAGERPGSAYVFERHHGGLNNWGEVLNVKASDPGNGDRFGWSVSVDGTTAVIGAYQDNSTVSNTGSVYVFDRDQGGVGAWGEVLKILASDPGIGAEFGYSVQLYGDTLLVGAVRADAPLFNSGAAYVFERDHGGVGAWGEVRKLVDSGGGTEDRFGVSVSLHGELAVVGALGDDSGGVDAGSASVFWRDAGGVNNWGQVGNWQASDAEMGAFFGIAVSLSGDTVLVGASRDDHGPVDSGAAYVFRLGRAVEVTRLGAPANPNALLPGQTGGPVCGSTWDPVVDHTTFLPGAVVDVLLATPAPANVPLPALGTLLCDLSLPFLELVGVPGVPFLIPIPADCSLVNVSLCVQAASASPTQVLLTNALDVRIGTF